MCDMDLGFDFDVESDVSSEIEDYESNMDFASSFEGLNFVEDTSHESIDEVSLDDEGISDSGFDLEVLDSNDGANFEFFDDMGDVNSDIDSNADFEPSLDELESVDDTSYETVDAESENDYAEFVEDAEVLDSLESLSDGNNLELLENGIDTDLSSLADVTANDISDENTEHFEAEQEDASAPFESIEIIDDAELLTNEQVEIADENNGATMGITALEDAANEESFESIPNEASSENLETIIENPDDNAEVTENVSENEEQADVGGNQLTLNEPSDEMSYSESEIVMEENEGQEINEIENEKDRLEALRDLLLSIKTEDDVDENADDDSPKTLTREITPEVIESRERDTEETLENYRENLREYGVPEERIDEFVEQEREKINAEYESLDHGDTSSNIYYQPTDWEEVAKSLSLGQSEQNNEDVLNKFDIKQETEQTK